MLTKVPNDQRGFSRSEDNVDGMDNFSDDVTTMDVEPTCVDFSNFSNTIEVFPKTSVVDMVDLNREIAILGGKQPDHTTPYTLEHVAGGGGVVDMKGLANPSTFNAKNTP